MDKVARVQDEIDEAADLMRSNIEKVVDRGEHLELLVDKSEGFSANARAFQRQSSSLKNAMWWKWAKQVACVSSLVLLVICIGLWFFCGWGLRSCRAKPPSL
jgi:vesicle-associated membrane protein 7